MTVSDRLEMPFGCINGNALGWQCPVYHLVASPTGVRFADEGEDTVFYTYAKMGREILRQRNALAFQVFDQKTVPLLEPRYSTGIPIEGATIEELADRVEEKYGHMGFGKAAFIETLHGYNAAVQEGAFDPTKKDGKRTEGLQPEKTNWATRIEDPPFVVYGATVGITPSQAGSGRRSAWR